LKYVETENRNLRNTNIILKGELSSCEEENYKLENTINRLKKQLENYEKLKEELDHTKGELLLTTKKLKKLEKRTEKLDEILSSQRCPNDKIGLGYNDSLKTTKQEKEVENDETNILEQVEQQDKRLEFRRMRHQEDPLRSGMKSIIMKETTEEYIVNPDGPHHRDHHLLPGIKISFLDIVILVKILDTRQSIVESMKGITMQAT
jgi:hypothetical protein